jgi:hypothetical protein
LLLQQLLLLLQQIDQILDVLPNQVIEMNALLGFLFDVVLELPAIVLDVVKQDLVHFALVLSHLFLVIVEGGDEVELFFPDLGVEDFFSATDVMVMHFLLLLSATFDVLVAAVLAVLVAAVLLALLVTAVLGLSALDLVPCAILLRLATAVFESAGWHVYIARRLYATLLLAQLLPALTWLLLATSGPFSVRHTSTIGNARALSNLV